MSCPRTKTNDPDQDSSRDSVVKSSCLLASHHLLHDVSQLFYWAIYKSDSLEKDGYQPPIPTVKPLISKLCDNSERPLQLECNVHIDH